MEIIQEIGSYAGFAAILGLAVLSALYFSQARDVKRLREWAGRAPERTTSPGATAQPQRVVAQPIPRPGPVVPRPPGPAPATPAAQPAQASATGAAPAVASGGPAPATPAAGKPADADADDERDEDREQASDDRASDETAIHEPLATTPAGGDEPTDPEDPDRAPDEAPDGGEQPQEPSASEDGPSSSDADAEDADGEPEPHESEDTGEWNPEDEHADLGYTDEHDAVPAATPLPPRPPQPFPRRGTAVPAPRSGRGSILPPYAESRPAAEPRSASPAGRGRRPLLLALAGMVALAIGVFAVLQVTGGDDAETGGGGGLSADTSTSDTSSDEAPVDPASVTVAVLNGTTQPGLAAQIGDSIANEGFLRGVVTNNSDQERAESVVLYAPGAEREAIDVSRRLDIPQREPIDPASQALAGDATVVVIAGSDQIR